MSNKDIRKEAWGIMWGHFLYFIKGNIPQLVFTFLMFAVGGQWFLRSIIQLVDFERSGGIGSFLVGFVLLISVGLVGGILLAYGYQIYLLRLVRYEEKGMQNALSGFSYLGLRYLGITLPIGLLMAAITGLIERVVTDTNFAVIGSIIGAVLSVMVGLVMWIVPYLIHDYPDKTAGKTLRFAWDKMRGHKWNFFKLQIPPVLLYFIGSIGLTIVGGILLYPRISAMIQAGNWTGLWSGEFLILILLYFVFSLVYTFYVQALYIGYYENRLATLPQVEPYYSVDPEF